MHPASSSHHSLCLLRQTGISWCPGCGLGHSIHFFLHGNWNAAFHYHWLGPFATCMLIIRSIQLLYLQYKTFSHLKRPST
ncbi:DUF2752 domain-containing protein [Chitinophaga pendula]